MKSPLVTTEWLEQNLSHDKLILLDASMEKVVGKSPILYDTLACIPGAQKLDLENVLCDLSASMTHAFPTAEQFWDVISTLGITSNSHIVIYDNQGIYSSPRAWWIFRVMGFDNVYVLNGGLPQWLDEGRVTANHYSASILANPVLDRDSELMIHMQDAVCDSAYLLDNLSNKEMSIFDARGASRFSGQAPEPRAGVRSGHIPNSINLPFSKVLDGHCLKIPEQLSELFTEITVKEKDNPLAGSERIFSCGSGITACILILASVATGHHNNVLYDGSWADWGSDHKLPVEL
ncbi:sulfurtransferase [Shewanella eurypsychrophilus]|uniref:Sulfurtransferase n=1 Tax=Shewanella eurypsychrophilus TaxID=2593656 RepID=A0ABX6VCK7_9GAMM|nr:MULTISPECIES: sulfurtransferase [Shewanella]QFU25277.1 sulfurtransferase [Shewanella sp. YLB-09]QPG60426.1 sulfurtransferase [Shewanella eurypsychrophilus]